MTRTAPPPPPAADLCSGRVLQGGGESELGGHGLRPPEADAAAAAGVQSLAGALDELFLLANKNPAASRRAVPPSMITAWPCSFRKEKRHLAVLNRQADPSVWVRSVVGKPGVGRLTGTVQSAVRGGHGRVLQNHTPLPYGSPLPRQAVMTEPGQDGDSLSPGRTRADDRAVRPKGRPAGTDPRRRSRPAAPAAQIGTK